MVIAALILLIIAVVMFGPAIAAAVGSFFFWIIFVAFAVTVYPAVRLLCWKDRRESAELYDLIIEAETKDDASGLLALKERRNAVENRIHKKISVVSYTLVGIAAVLLGIKLGTII